MRMMTGNHRTIRLRRATNINFAYLHIAHDFLLYRILFSAILLENLLFLEGIFVGSSPGTIQWVFHSFWCQHKDRSYHGQLESTVLLTRHIACLYSCSSFGNWVGAIVGHFSIALNSVRSLSLVVYFCGILALLHLWNNAHKLENKHVDIIGRYNTLHVKNSPKDNSFGFWKNEYHMGSLSTPFSKHIFM